MESGPLADKARFPMLTWNILAWPKDELQIGNLARGSANGDVVFMMC